MDLWTDTKYWLRSGSLHFARDRRSLPGSPTTCFTWKKRAVFYRPGTSDTELLYRVLLKPRDKREYRLPQLRQEPVILDIGANIGAFSLLALDDYPSAKLFAFEPVQANFELLKLNLIPFGTAKIYNFGLGRTDESVPFFSSDDPKNLGGYSRFEAGSDLTKQQFLLVKKANELLCALGVDRIDLIKIDTEGAEFEILTAIPQATLSQVSWVLGELHGQRDFELLAYLEQWFDLDVKKALGSRLSSFRARNKNLTARASPAAIGD